MQTVLYCYVSNIKDLENALNEDLSRTGLWLNRKKLTLNIENTKSLLIGSDRKLLATTVKSISIYLTKKLRALDALDTWV